MDDFSINIIAFCIAWIFDYFVGDPPELPHLIVGYGKCISFFEKCLNKGAHRILKGATVAAGLIILVFILSFILLRALSPWPLLKIAVEAVLIFYCLAGTTLIREVRQVFEALDKSIEAGRRQVGRIVGRDTANLSEQEIRTAALETLAENLSDGVIAPLFWFALLGVPGMLAYKMVNTLDSMVGYKNVRYKEFGCVAARIDDVTNYIPARITAILMVIASGHPRLIQFVVRNGKKHASPNSGYPEAALAGALDCRFGGPHDYFGERVYKPFIGENERDLRSDDVAIAIRINRVAEVLAVLLTVGIRFLILR